MIISSSFVEFHNLSLSLMPIQNFSAAFSASFEFQKFHSQNMKLMAKDKKNQYRSYLTTNTFHHSLSKRANFHTFK
jgi:hypothetical protein